MEFDYDNIGVNKRLVLKDGLPVYHGPISTSRQETIAHEFSDETGMKFALQSDYENKFRMILGIDVQKISSNPREEEILLFNQYLPIVFTHSFNNDINNNVNHLLCSLRGYERHIQNPASFYKIMGLGYQWQRMVISLKNYLVRNHLWHCKSGVAVIQGILDMLYKNIYISSKDIDLSYNNYPNETWIPVMEQNKALLYDSSNITSKTVLHRINEELRLSVLNEQYKVLKQQFDIEIFAAFNSFRIIPPKIHSNYTNTICLLQEDAQSDEQTAFLEFAADTILMEQFKPIGNLSIKIKNADLFGIDQFIKVQDINPELFDAFYNDVYCRLELQGNIIIFNNNQSINPRFHEQILNSKYLLTMDDEIIDDELLENRHIYEFQRINQIYFIIPYGVEYEDITIYAQFKQGYNWVAIKTFENTKITYDHNNPYNKLSQTISIIGLHTIRDHYLENHPSKQVTYLFNTISQILRHNFAVPNPTIFWDQINIAITPKHINIINNHPMRNVTISKQNGLSIGKILYDDLSLFDLSMPALSPRMNIQIDDSMVDHREHIHRIISPKISGNLRQSRMDLPEEAMIVYDTFRIAESVEFAKEFYNALLQQRSDIRDIFNNRVSEEQVAKLLSMLQHSVKLLSGDMSKFNKTLKEQGLKHAQRNVKLSMLDSFGKILIATIKKINMEYYERNKDIDNDVEKWANKHDNAWKWFWNKIVNAFGNELEDDTMMTTRDKVGLGILLGGSAVIVLKYCLKLK